MQFPQPLARGVLVRRYKRFFAEVALEGGGEATAHCPNPGAMLGLNMPGVTVWLSKSPDLKRKLPYTWELVEVPGDGPDGFVTCGINTMHPNRIAAEAIAEGLIPELAGYPILKREVRYGENSRVDLVLEAPDRPACFVEVKSDKSFLQRDLRPDHSLWLEVKNCHLSRTKGVAEFPDCVAARSLKHLRELQTMVAEGDRAVVLFVVQRTDCEAFSACRELDPAFARGLDEAADAGVEVLVYACDVTVEEIKISRKMAWHR